MKKLLLMLFNGISLIIVIIKINQMSLHALSENVHMDKEKDDPSPLHICFKQYED